MGRPCLGELFAYRDKAGEIVADVQILHLREESKVVAVLDGEATDHVDERWVVLDNEEPLFYVERYRPVEHPSYGVFDPDGRHLGTYVSEGGLIHRNVTVREAASAPAATIRVEHHRHVLAEPDGRELGCCWRAFSAVGNDDDDEVWGLQIENQPVLLDRRVLVAAPLVCHLTAFPKRHFDAGGEIALLMVVLVPPVGLAMAGVERAIDGLYWLRRRLD